MKSEQPSKSVDLEPLPLGADIPIVCTPGVFSREERSAHLELSIDVVTRWPRQRRELPDGFLLEYEGDEERFLALARWASAEHRCCPWAAYSVEMGPFLTEAQGAIRLRVRANEEGRALLRAGHEDLARSRDDPPITLRPLGLPTGWLAGDVASADGA